MFFAIEYIKSMINRTKKSQSNYWASTVFVILFLATILIWLKSQYLISIMTDLKSDAYENRGAYGDSFGMITSLFSSLTFFLVLYGIYYQRKEMSTQNEMLNLSKRQHYFDRAYAFLEKNINKLKDQEIGLSRVFFDMANRGEISNWETLKVEDLNNTENNTVEINTNIVEAIKALKNLSEHKLPPYIIILSDVDRLLKKLLGDKELNNEDYGCIKEVIKLQLDKDFRKYISTTLKFYNTYLISELFLKTKSIKIAGNRSYNHQVDSKSKYYNLEPLIRMQDLYS